MAICVVPSLHLMADAKTTFGRRLRLLRKARGMTLEQLGNAASLGFKHIHEIEKAQKTPSFEAVDKLAGALGVQPYELFLPTDGDTKSVNQAFDRLIGEVRGRKSVALKRALLVLLPLMEQYRTDSDA